MGTFVLIVVVVDVIIYKKVNQISSVYQVSIILLLLDNCWSSLLICLCDSNYYSLLLNHFDVLNSVNRSYYHHHLYVLLFKEVGDHDSPYFPVFCTDCFNLFLFSLALLYIQTSSWSKLLTVFSYTVSPSINLACVKFSRLPFFKIFQGI